MTAQPSSGGRVLRISAIATSAWGIAVTVALARGRTDAYRNALIVLVISAIVAGVQTYVSVALRGKGAPQNMRFYLTTLVLIAFLVLRLPPIWKLIGGFTGGTKADFETMAGLAAFWGGLVALTTPLWASPTRIGPDGAQWVNVLRTPLLLGGALLTLTGSALLWRARRVEQRKEVVHARISS